jgi:predicted nucleotidyltransferase
MLKDQIDLLSAFNAHGVEYVVIGGHAVNAYTEARFTKDIDLLIRNTEANGYAVFKALASFGTPLAGITPADFSGKPDQFFLLGVEPNRIDILQSIPGVATEDVWRDSVAGELDNISVRFISLDHLVTNKLAAGRQRDLGDVEELRKFQGKRSS